MQKEFVAMFGSVIAQIIRTVLDMVLSRVDFCPDCASKVRDLKERN